MIPPNISTYPINDPTIEINITGNIKTKNGPKKFLQKDFWINFINGMKPKKNLKFKLFPMFITKIIL